MRYVIAISLSFFLTILHAQVDDFNAVLIGNYQVPSGSTEIISFDATSARVFSTNGANNTLDIIDFSDPTAPSLFASINLSAYGTSINSVSTKNGTVAVALVGTTPQSDGVVAFFDTNGNFINSVMVGALPDMLTFTPDGTKVLVANEGEPNDAYTIDPLGSISIIDVTGGIAALSAADVTTIDFSAITMVDSSTRIFGNNGMATIAEDLEPEYITVTDDSQRAFVALQENNAFAEIDLNTMSIVAITGFGFKDFGAAGNGLDASDKDNAINIQPWANLFGMFQPDGLACFSVAGEMFIVSANEGDARSYAGFDEESRIKDLTLDNTVFASTIGDDENLGRLNVTTTLGDANQDGEYEALYAYGTRSFSIWKADGTLVYDSGDDFETTIESGAFAAYFNSNNDDNTSFDKRSDNKGVEPEAVELIHYDDKTIALIGLERMGGMMVYDVSDPYNPVFLNYISERDFTLPESNTIGLGPEGILWIPASDSPTSTDLILVANEVSNNISIFGPDCMADITLSGVQQTDIHQAGNTITSSGQVATGQDVIYRAGNCIELVAPFEVLSNATFTAEIKACIDFCH